MERCQIHDRTPVILANAHCVKGRGLFGRLVIALLTKRGGYRTELENLIISLKNYQHSLDSSIPLEAILQTETAWGVPAAGEPAFYFCQLI